MLIACLGWGSLIWDPRHLPIRGTWFEDGPFLPIEFARESGNGRTTLVIVPDAVARKHQPAQDPPALVRTLWIPLDVLSLPDAKKALKAREETNDNLIGSWELSGGMPADPIELRIAEWAVCSGIDAVVWANLPPKLRKHGSGTYMPSADEVLAHLKGLSYAKGRCAEQYIRMTPRQIDTQYRRRIERELGWTPIGSI